MGTYKGDRRNSSRGGDRRRDPRVGAHLNAHLAMSESFLYQEMSLDESRNIELYGYVRDLSATGMGIVIPSVSFDTRTCLEGLSIHLTFVTTKEAVEIQAEAIRCAPLDRREPLKGYVVGAKLGELSEQTRMVLAAHLSRLPEA